MVHSNQCIRVNKKLRLKGIYISIQIHYLTNGELITYINNEIGLKCLN